MLQTLIKGFYDNGTPVSRDDNVLLSDYLLNSLSSEARSHATYAGTARPVKVATNGFITASGSHSLHAEMVNDVESVAGEFGTVDHVVMVEGVVDSDSPYDFDDCGVEDGSLRVTVVTGIQGDVQVHVLNLPGDSVHDYAQRVLSRNWSKARKRLGL